MKREMITEGSGFGSHDVVAPRSSGQNPTEGTRQIGGSPPSPGVCSLSGFSDGALKPGWIGHDGPASKEPAVRGRGIRRLSSILLADPAQVQTTRSNIGYGNN
jgi:hypothetical protein